MEEESIPISVICETWNVSRSAYDSWRREDVSTRRREDNRLMPIIRDIWENKRRYGAHRIAKELAARKQPCSRGRVGRLMEQMGLLAIHYTAHINQAGHAHLIRAMRWAVRRQQVS